MTSKIKLCLFLLGGKEEKIKTLILMILLIVYALLEIVGIGSFPVYLLSILKPDFLQNLITEYSFYIFNLKKYSQETILINGGIFLVVFFIIKNIFFLLITRFEKKFIYKLISANTVKLYKIYHAQKYVFHLNTNPSTLIRNIDLVEDATLYVSYFLSFIRELLILTVTFSFLILINFKVTIFSFIFFLISIFILFSFIKRKAKNYGQNVVDLRTFFFKIITEGMESIKEVKILNKSEYFSNHFKENSKNLFYNKYKIDFLRSIPRIYLEILAVSFMCFLFIYFFNITKVIEIAIINIATYSVVIVRMLPSLTSISTSVANLKSVYPSANTLVNEFNRKSNLSSISDSSFSNSPTKKDFANFCTLEINNINYGYTSEKKIISNFSIKIYNKEVLGIKGASGSGKTTLINIILGLLEPDSGELKINNFLVKNFSDLKNIFGLVSQNIYLLDETVTKNIAFGLIDSDVEDKQLKKAAKLAQADKFINSLENGYNTIIGNKGVKLSGGQMQRIGIARALYANPKILVMDESTSALDIENENKILDVIKDLKKEMAIIIISHRESTLKICDRVVDLGR